MAEHLLLYRSSDGTSYACSIDCKKRYLEHVNPSSLVNSVAIIPRASSPNNKNKRTRNGSPKREEVSNSRVPDRLKERALHQQPIPLTPEMARMVARATYAVVDTNGWILDLELILSLQHSKLTVIVPSVVLQELDGLKKDSDVSYQARMAIKAIHDALNERQPWIRGQRYDQDIAQLRKVNNDDFVLSCALYFQRLAPTVLVTGDYGLATKAIINQLPSTDAKGLLQCLPSLGSSPSSSASSSSAAANQAPEPTPERKKARVEESVEKLLNQLQQYARMFSAVGGPTFSSFLTPAGTASIVIAVLSSSSSLPPLPSPPQTVVSSPPSSPYASATLGSSSSVQVTTTQDASSSSTSTNAAVTWPISIQSGSVTDGAANADTSIDTQANNNNNSNNDPKPVVFDILSALPRELTSRVLAYLPPRTLLKVQGVSVAWYDMAQDATLWHLVIQRFFNINLLVPQRVGSPSPSPFPFEASFVTSLELETQPLQVNAASSSKTKGTVVKTEARTAKEWYRSWRRCVLPS